MSADRPLRVLQVIPSLAARTGGTAESVVQSSIALQNYGLETTIFATELGSAVSARQPSRVSASALPSGAEELDVRLFPTRRPHSFAFSPELYRALAKATGGYDVVHIHSLFLFPQLAAYRQAVRQRVPYVVTPHGILDPYHRQHGRLRKQVTDVLWQRRLLEGASALHLTSDEEARLVADVAPAVPRVIASIGVHWPRFQNLPEPERFRREQLGGHSGPIVLHLGRVSHKKGPDVLIRSFAVASREFPEARLVFVGPDDEGLTPKLTALAAELGIDSKVTFTGMLPGEESKLQALAAADVWALSSNAENFGIAVAEAMAAGRAIVISPLVNIAPEIARANAGLVCERSPEAFGAGLASLLRDAGLREELGGRAREFAKGYDWAALAPGLAQVYDGARR
ncbi:MAG: glycosyltransferase [Actinobacteria bacterium]|nr:glycosyltransferase [Actinomycetota bacterium]